MCHIETDIPISVSTPQTFLYGIANRCDKYRIEAPNSPSGPPYCVMINCAHLWDLFPFDIYRKLQSVFHNSTYQQPPLFIHGQESRCPCKWSSISALSIVNGSKFLAYSFNACFLAFWYWLNGPLLFCHLGVYQDTDSYQSMQSWLHQYNLTTFSYHTDSLPARPFPIKWFIELWKDRSTL
mgnify:CR=1 FL=1